MQLNVISPFQSLRWYYSVSVKIARIVPGYTATLIILTLISQISLLAASFLPLKAIILISSPEVPDYFPASWKDMGRENLFLALSLSAVIIYALHLTAEKLIKHFTQSGSQQLLANSGKMILYQGQESIASKAYLRFTRSLASVSFVACTIFLLGILYSDLMVTIIILWISITTAYALIKIAHARLYEKLLAVITETPNTVASIGFLAAFGFITYDFLDENPPEILAAIIGLLLTRQLMQRLALLAQDTTSLLTKKLQITSLFFHSHRATPIKSTESSSFWNLFSDETIDDLISSILYNVTGKPHKISTVCWHQIGVHDIAAFEVSTNKHLNSSSQNFLIKIFNTKRSIFAINEATLLADATHHSLPSLPFIGACLTGQFHCNVFKLNDAVKVDQLHTKEPSRQAQKKMMMSTPSPYLIKLYSRSHPSITDRLNLEELSNFIVAIRTTRFSCFLESFVLAHENILAALKDMPLQVANFDIGKDHLLTDSYGEILVSHWGIWSLEPVGSGWQCSIKETQQLPLLFNEVRETRHDMAHISFPLFKLSVLLSALDRYLIKQHFIYAAQLLPEIMNAYSQHSAATQSEIIQ